MPLAYIHLINVPFPADKFPDYPLNSIDTFGKLSKHTVIVNNGYTKETGEAELEKGLLKLFVMAHYF